ncbi:MAG: hypothetical protein ACI85K_002748 [Hyphomicrobiaceae bacterium]|jgi:hypothetical protein
MKTASMKTVAPRKMMFLVAISLWLVSCTIATTGGSTEAANDAASRAQLEEQWALVMQDLDEACRDIDKRLLRQPAGDLNVVAARAQEAAERISLGYGKMDHRHVPGFASMSRDCESWFLQIAIEANNGRRVIAADLYRSGRKQHCARCHDAHGAIK